jgi:hypothetical protein
MQRVNRNISNIPEHSEHVKQPYDYEDNGYDIQDVLDLGIHRNVRVYQPQQNTDHD